MRFAKYKLLGRSGLNVATSKSHVAARAAAPSFCRSNKRETALAGCTLLDPALLLHGRYLKLLLCLES